MSKVRCLEFWIVCFLRFNYMNSDCLAEVVAVTKTLNSANNYYAVDLINIPCRPTKDGAYARPTRITNITFEGLYPSMVFNAPEDRIYFTDRDAVVSVFLNGTSRKIHDGIPNVVAFDLDVEQQLLFYGTAVSAEVSPYGYHIDKFQIRNNSKQSLAKDLAVIHTISVDSVNRKVFWMSTFFDTLLESMNYDGSERMPHRNTKMAALLDVDPYSQTIFYSKSSILRYQRYNGSDSVKINYSVNALVCFNVGSVLLAYGNRIKHLNVTDKGIHEPKIVYIDNDKGVKISKISVISKCPETSTSAPSSTYAQTTPTEQTMTSSTIPKTLKSSTSSVMATTSSIITSIGLQEQKTKPTPTSSGIHIAVICLSIFVALLIVVVVVLVFVLPRLRNRASRSDGSSAQIQSLVVLQEY